ncbi:MAG: 3-phosphoshikimate 1-carboxyvinyltransferase [Bacteroidales bacterium]|jgi:3-phosphoshikimate 1-carboxyvinyltransferase|nr:3-phosphoshikimate 1-carboxyvinyltransferase [Bacteroidales bacterium]
MSVKITAPKKVITTFRSLPASKSLSNRALIISALCKESFKIKNLSNSDDTQVLNDALQNLTNSTIDIGAAGTAMRFLTALLSAIPGEKILTGSERMKQRPIHELVNILKEFGAKIEYTEKEGFPPLKITGNKLTARDISIKGNISSQYISALLMIAPYLEGGFNLTVTDKILSKDYIRMTIKLMIEFGAEIEWNEDKIHVNKGAYKPQEIIIEGDWSAASYWFEVVSLSKNAMIELTGLKRNSFQGDSVLTELYKTLGVDSAFTNFGIRIKNTTTTCEFFEYDFTDCPDLAQTITVTLVAKKIPFKLTGLDNLSIKETDRIKALVVEFKKLGITILAESNHTLLWRGNEEINVPENHFVETYEDHRMALAFAPLSIVTKEIVIKNSEVVTKSYPDYWNNLKEAGFGINYL